MSSLRRGVLHKMKLDTKSRIINKEGLLYHLDKIVGGKLTNEDKNLAASLINLAERERIDLRKVSKKEPLNLSYDVIEWKKNKYKKPLRDLKMSNKPINFSIDAARVTQISGLKRDFLHLMIKNFIMQLWTSLHLDHVCYTFLSMVKDNN